MGDCATCATRKMPATARSFNCSPMVTPHPLTLYSCPLLANGNNTCCIRTFTTAIEICLPLNRSLGAGCNWNCTQSKSECHKAPHCPLTPTPPTPLQFICLGLSTVAKTLFAFQFWLFIWLARPGHKLPGRRSSQIANLAAYNNHISFILYYIVSIVMCVCFDCKTSASACGFVVLAKELASLKRWNISMFLGHFNAGGSIALGSLHIYLYMCACGSILHLDIKAVWQINKAISYASLLS